MTGDPEQRLAAALRAQAAGLGAGSPAPIGAVPVGAVPPPAGSEVTSPTTQPRPRLSAWTVLALAVLLGALAGGLAGAISAW